jgi:hypothetical protein
MIELLIENIDYHISNILILFSFSLVYTTIKLRFFRVNIFFLKEFMKNFFAIISIYLLYILLLVLQHAN